MTKLMRPLAALVIADCSVLAETSHSSGIAGTHGLENSVIERLSDNRPAFIDCRIGGIDKTCRILNVTSGFRAQSADELQQSLPQSAKPAFPIQPYRIFSIR